MAEVEHITPYGTEGDTRAKSEQVRDMFDTIAPAYDLMNRMMSVGSDRHWRRRCVRAAAEVNPRRVLDLATGTGDLAIEIAERIDGAHVSGADLSEGMVRVGRRKVTRKGLDGRVDLRIADALNLPFADNTFDAVTIAFGVRNFEDIARGYREMLRVLRPGGKLVVLELTAPRRKVLKPFYRFYTGVVIPAAGRMVSSDARAYAYLPESIAAVPARADMTAIMTDVGFADATWRSMTLGVATLYEARKPG